MEEITGKENENQITEDIGSTAGHYPTWLDMLALIGTFLGATVVASLISLALIQFGSASESFAIFLAYLIQFSITLFVALYQKRSRAPEDKPLLRFTFRRVNPAIVLWGIILAFAVSIIVEPIVNFFPESYFESMNRMMVGGWMQLCILVFAPVLEEILFRGIIQEGLTAKYGMAKGILFASLIFGVIHINPPQAINAFFLGLVLGYIYYRSCSLIPVILIHAVNNIIAYFTWLLGGEKMVDTSEMIGNPTLYAIVYAIACLIFIVALITVSRLIRREKQMKEAEEGR